MAYTSLPEIQRKLELANALASRRSNNFGTQSGSITSGLAQVLNQYRAGKLSKEAAAAQSENEQIRKSDLQSLTEALTGSAGPSQPVSMMKFQSPEVQETASKFALEEAMMQREAENRRRMNPPSMSLSPVWGQDAQGNYIPMQMSSQGGISPVSVPEGVRVLPNAGLAEFDPSMIQQRGAAQTGVDVANIEATTAPTAARAGAVEAATQAARTGAMPEQLAIQNAAEISGTTAADVEQKQRDANAVISLLDMAEPLLDSATASTAGNIRDQAAALLGISTTGAEAAAQLKALGGLLISRMPRMQGPQSNLDVQLYREMAGQIGDPTIPADTRRAAMQTIRMLNEKYAGGAQAQPAVQSPFIEVDW